MSDTKIYTVRLDYDDCRFLKIEAESEEEARAIVDRGHDDERFVAAFWAGEPGEGCYAGYEIWEEEDLAAPANPAGDDAGAME